MEFIISAAFYLSINQNRGIFGMRKKIDKSKSHSISLTYQLPEPTMHTFVLFAISYTFLTIVNKWREKF